MKRIAFLAGGDGWHVLDLHRAAGQLAIESVTVDFRRVHAGIGVQGSALADFNGVLVRTMPPGSLEQVVFRMDILHRLKAGGATVMNPPLALEACVDKYLASARLEAAGLPVPRTVVCQTAEAAQDAFYALGNDVVVKPLFGSEGRGMVRVSDPDIAWRTFRTLERTQSVLYLQQFIAHPGWDLRAFVIGGRVVTAMRRFAKNGWRTNVAQGGRGELVRLTPEQEGLAIRAADAVGALVAGVDILPGPSGEWYILEVNAVPGWRALAPIAGLDIAAAILDFMIRE